MSFTFKRLYPYSDVDAARSVSEIWVTKQVVQFGRTLTLEVYWRFRLLLTKTADEGAIRNEQIFRHIGEGFYEFKVKTERLYCFYDGRRLVLTHGDKKRSDRAVEERKRAGKIKTEYFAWIGSKK